MRWPRFAARSVALCALAGTLSSLVAAAPAATQTPAPAPLERPVWLCRPGLPDNPCNQDGNGNPQRAGPGGAFTNRYPSGTDVTLDATRVVAGEPAQVERYAAPDDPPIDCFYVYPTVDIVPNPLLQVGSTPPTAQDHHMDATLAQASRFANQCRLFVPLYRQVTLPTLALALLAGVEPDPGPGLLDVEQAWLDYWANHNVDPATGRRRGVVLLGHSQGTANLIRVLQEHVDGDPVARDRIVSAVLLGTDVLVPFDRPAGGGSDPASTFQHLPACERPSVQDPVPTGCVVSYASYAQRDSQPPVAGGLFGRSTVPGHRALCTNPAGLLRGTPDAVTPLDASFTTLQILGGAVLSPTGYLEGLLAGWLADPPTGYGRYPASFEGQCRQAEDADGNWSWLQITGTPGMITPGTEESIFGLHNFDANLALGDLTALVAAQSDAWLRQHA